MVETHPDRRSFLMFSGAGLGLPAVLGGRVPPRTRPRQALASPMDQVSAYVAASRFVDLPPEVLEKAKHHLLDTLAAMVSGVTMKAGKLAVAFTETQGGKDEAQVAASPIRTTAINAALANGILAHADETDDSHEPSGTHPGCAVVPAALAVAERQGADGLSLLRAIVAGYDIGCRMNAALDRELLGASNHSTHAIGGVFGAAAAAASILGLDQTRVRHVLDYAGQQASGVRYWVRDTEHVEKAFVFGGMPARNGTTAAVLVASGFTGVADLFTGEANFLDTFSTQPRPERLADGLGRRFEIMATNIKKYPVGSPIQAPLEAVTTLIGRHRIKSDDVTAVAVRMPSKRTVDNRDMPDVNLQYILAVTLVDGRLTFDAAHSYERMRDRSVLSMKERITVDEDPGLRTAESSRTALVEITLRGGGTFREQVKAVPGTAQRPMTREEVAAKCRALFTPVLGGTRADQLIEAVQALERLADVRHLRNFLSAKPA